MIKTQYVTKVHLTPDELAQRWSVHPATLRKWRMKAWGPMFLKLGHLHGTVCHGKGEYVRGEVHTNTIESFWSQFKRSVHGTFHAVSPKHLQTYLDEFSFRYNHRGALMPVVMFARVGMPAKAA